MGTWMLSVSACFAVSSLASHSLGFSLDNLAFNLADFGKRDTGNGNSPGQTAVDALIDYILKMSHTSYDGDVVLAELAHQIDRYFEAQTATDDAMLDYLLEAFDSNNAGYVTLAEVREMLDQYFEPQKDEVITKLKNALDSNGDGEELIPMRAAQKSRHTLTEQAELADYNYDELSDEFSEEEARLFEKLMSTELSPDQLRRAKQYLNRVDHLGQDV